MVLAKVLKTAGKPATKVDFVVIPRANAGCSPIKKYCKRTDPAKARFD